MHTSGGTQVPLRHRLPVPGDVVVLRERRIATGGLEVAARIRPVEIKRRLFICEPPLCRNSALAVTYQPPGTQRDGRCELKWF